MRVVLVVVVLGILALIAPRIEPFGPRAEIASPVTVIGRATPIRFHLTDRGTGLRSVEVRIVPSTGGDGTIVARQEYPRQSWFGSGVHDTTLDATLDAAALPEGPADLQVYVTDHAWWSVLRRGPRCTQTIAIDVTPPILTPASAQHRIKVGGSELVVYHVSADATQSGVQVGARFFPGVRGYFADPELGAALFTIPVDDPTLVPQLTATDAAGNTASSPFDVVVQPRKTPEKTLPLTQEFLARKVPELLKAGNLPNDGDLVAGYLRINRELRATSEHTIQQACIKSANEPRWQGPFSRLPNGAPLAGFADRRAYDFNGQIVDHQWHMGFDLASLKMSPVPAANSGIVAFAGPIGIYGNTVLIDHGFGLFSLYGHLSQIDVAVGATVGRNQIIGKTGETGLAGGDHLHFGINIHGTHVDPVEWWDAHWIQDHIDLRLKAYPRAVPPAAVPTPGGAPS